MNDLPPTTAELCATVEEFAAVREAMVVDADVRLLFVVLRPGKVLDDALRMAITARLRAAEPSRSVPDAIYDAPALPRAADGGKHVAAVQRILVGLPPDNNADLKGVLNPEALRYFADLFNNL